MSVEALRDSFVATRRQFLTICEPLEVEDYGLQAAEFASPPKWHLAHTTWFFETFLLKQFLGDYEPVDPMYEVLFNSYYNGIGAQHPRAQRGLLSRPLLSEVLSYREHVDKAMLLLLATASVHEECETILSRTVLGIEHERQHQELFFTDVKYSLGANPLYPTYRSEVCTANEAPGPLQWTKFEGGLIEIGHNGKGFCFDNEQPRHRVYIEPFEIANRLVTNGDYQDFIDDGGYERPEFWLADGWATAQREHWTAPLHWHEREGESVEFTLGGLKTRSRATPLCHVSGYEADAYARWAGARLPTEAQWEHMAEQTKGSTAPRDINDAHLLHCHPESAKGGGLEQLYGACWQWTQTAYSPYPGFAPSTGAIGEYNGKFMSNQWVLRGGSCVTPSSQARPGYRNFFYPQDRWQFSGIRLAR
ncbi:ergothioneine biosynthesis protein EgtB [Congregibacter variabilis]|uniref:Ergothioneine biosynthesis protein EgtB n=1 Tax=Congregibacter variabilis TaxID=3081200 RepID=A0ABZ0I0T5_9GAMM|nr:ergothioneine biosynthesis protein EgtB [Congregibacter sp. IMCC43200]